MDPPRHADVADISQLRSAVAAAGCGWLVTVGPDGAPSASLLPVTWQGDAAAVRVPRDNPQRQHVVRGAPVVVLCPSAPYAVRLSGPVRAIDDTPTPDEPSGDVRVEVSVFEIRAEAGAPNAAPPRPAAGATPRPAAGAARPPAPAAKPGKAPRARAEPREEPSPTEIVRFFCEIAVYLSVAIVALSMTAPTWQRIAIAAGAVLAMGLGWGLLASPKAPFPLRGFARTAFETAWFAVGPLALWAAGQPRLAAIVAAVIVGNGVATALLARRSAR